jgi:hypothetical protein
LGYIYLIFAYPLAGSVKEIGIVISYKEDKHTKSDTITIVNNDYITKEQTFWATFEELEIEESENPDNITIDDKKTVSGQRLREALVYSGKFSDIEEADQMIKTMVKEGKLREVIQDTLRRIDQ